MEDIGALLSAFADWVLGLADYLTSAIVAVFEAVWIFLSDWAVFGLETAIGTAAARLAGYDVSIPTPAQLMTQLPPAMQQIVYRVGLPEAFGYWATAVTVRFGIWGIRLASYLRAW